MDFSKSDCLYISERKAWRKWLEKNFDKRDQIWLVYPHKSTGEPCIIYNDAVEEALCFGWIDSIKKSLDESHAIQRFTPRRKGSSYSQQNIERIKWLLENDLIHQSLVEEAREIASQEFEYPDDIMETLKRDPEIWLNFKAFSEPYKRIRIAYIATARKHPEVFQQRLNNLLKHTKANKRIPGFGGIDKYY